MGRSPRSSRSAGKPRTWRRGAEGGTTFMTEELSVDSDNQADKAWLLGVQRKLYQWSKGTPEGAYGDVWNWVTDPRNLRCAWQTIAQNKGRRTPGVDGLTVASIAAGDGGVPLFLDGLREALRNGSYRPLPARRKWIPKPGDRGSSDPSVSPPSLTASFNARSRISWSQSSRRDSGRCRTGSGPGGAVTAHSNISGRPFFPGRRGRMGCSATRPING